MKIRYLGANPGAGGLLSFKISPRARFLSILGTLTQVPASLLSRDGQPQIKPGWSIWFEDPEDGPDVERHLLLVPAEPGEVNISPPANGPFSKHTLSYLGSALVPNALPVITTHLYELLPPNPVGASSGET